MDIRNKTVLILGGWGLVGSALAEKIVKEKPKKVILTSLLKNEATEICREMNKKHKTNLFLPWWGNVFVRYEYKDMSRAQYLNIHEKRLKVINDIVKELDDKMLRESSIYKLLKKFRPDIIIDCINTATAIAYQNIYKSYNDVLKITSDTKNKDYDKLLIASEKMICSSYIPQLIRHIQILYNSMLKFKTSFYFKIGTSGTGGMGLNIPFTHSEEKPSRVLLSKSSVAGAHTLLLFLMARTPDGPFVKEIKPTAAIAWKKIAYGEIKKKGNPIKLYDIDFNKRVTLKGVFKRELKDCFKSVGTLKTAFIDTGENGIFSRGEFEAITKLGQMEFVTPEEIADDVIREIKGGNTGHDVINALDNSVMDPSYRAGFLQHAAVRKISEMEKKHKTHSVAFEMLGPPRLSKLLYEAHLINIIYRNFHNFIKDTPVNHTRKILNLIKTNKKLRNEIVSIGIPILLPDGKNLIRGPKVIIPSDNSGQEIIINKKKIDKWAYDGWIDLRAENWKEWKRRFLNIIADAENKTEISHSSKNAFNLDYWEHFKSINIGKIVGWIFINEEKGIRMKG